MRTTQSEIERTLHPNQEILVSTTKIVAFSATKILLPIDFSPSSETAVDAATGLAQQKRLDRVPDLLAQQGEKTKQQYDQAHSIFTK